MKKLMIAFLAGSILIGIGLGVTALEVSRWDVAEHPYYLGDKDTQTQEITEHIDISGYETVEIYTTGNASSFRNDRIITIVEDENCTDYFTVKVDYKGEPAENYFYDFDGEDEDGNIIRNMHYVVQPNYNYSMRDMREMVEEMFREKIFYTENVNTLIEKVTVYTAHPEKFDILN